MRRMKLKDQFIGVIGVWTGDGDDEVTAWLAANPAWVAQLQTEDDQQIEWRTKPRRGLNNATEEDKQARKQLVILGPTMYDEVTLSVGSVLVLREDGRLSAFESENINDQYEEA